jgi:hypothetical protein
MDLRSIDTGADKEQVIITATVSCIGADAGSVEVFSTLQFPMQITEIQMVLASKLVTASSSHLIKVTDGTNDICANQTYAVADAIGTKKTPAVSATYGILNGSDKLVIVGTAGGTQSTAGFALVVIKAKKIGEAS